jgi:osmotically-inducible protein OsmY
MAITVDERLSGASHAAGDLLGQRAMQARIQMQLRQAPYLALRQVVCEIRDGVLLLRGRVPSYYMKQVAQSIVHCVESTLEIHNQLDVLPLPAGAEEG